MPRQHPAFPPTSLPRHTLRLALPLAAALLAAGCSSLATAPTTQSQAKIAGLEKQMQAAAKQLAFEEAAGYRDRIRELKLLELSLD